MERRKFIKQIAVGLSSLCAIAPGITMSCTSAKQKDSSKTVPISQTDKPLAIAMWDFSWILRHHRYGEFENWDRVIGELAERGYNAIRMDAMPHYVASTQEGKIIEEFRSVKDGWLPALWGNDYTMSFRPREALLEFLPLCKKHGVKVGLSSWFSRHGTNRRDIFMEEGGMLRAWTETLDFLDAHDLLDNVIYVDLLNEFPNNNGFDWLKQELNKRSDIKQFKLDNPEAHVPDPDRKKGNTLQLYFMNNFMTETIKAFKKKYPKLDFFFSFDNPPSDNVDVTEFGALDHHIWFHHKGGITGLDEIGSRDQTLDYRTVQAKIETYYKENKASLLEFVEGRINKASQIAARHNIPCGNTEGWGPIAWFDHPELDWSWVKESADICVDLALKHDNYKFICTSNFTHPQFKGLWEDIAWHRQITDRIKS